MVPVTYYGDEVYDFAKSLIEASKVEGLDATTETIDSLARALQAAYEAWLESKV